MVPVGIMLFVAKLAIGLVDSWLGAWSQKLVDVTVPWPWLRAIIIAVPGFSVLVLAGILLICGAIVSTPFGLRLQRLMDRVFLSIPLLGGVYSAGRNTVETFSKKSQFQRVVFVEKFPGSRVPAFVVAEVLDSRTQELWLAVVIPAKPNPTGGDVVFYKASEVSEAKLTRGEVVQWGVSMGLLTPSQWPITGDVDNSGKQS
jgi:uncharacterized membrane protein